ncbi:MAG: diaminopimelate decarboxylase [Clostridia bacterium]
MKYLPFDRNMLEDITKKYPTPFYLYDERALCERTRRLYDAFAWNKGFREYYAVKACPNPEVLRAVTSVGAGLDCSSYTELMMAEAMGITGENIMFSSNATPARDFEYARRLNATINLDDITHIDFLIAHGGIPDIISCRFNPGGEFRIGNTIMGNPGEAKYGFTRPQLTSGFKRLLDIGVKRFGIHAFLASNTTDENYYPVLAKLMFKTARELHEQTGAQIAFVNLSGGVGIPYYDDNDAIDIARVGSRVEEAYRSELTAYGMQPAVFTELGRYISGPAGYLVTRAVHRKDTYKRFIGVDACAVNLMRPAIYGAYHHISVMGKEDLPHDHIYDITGSLCENNDKFAIDRPLPQIDMGDLLVIHDAGAHGFSMGYNYNGKLRSAELMLKKDGGINLIRRAETPSDYFATLDVLGFDRLKMEE